MKTYLLGDIHGEIDFQSIYRWGPHPNDRLIQMGDFGLIFTATQNRKTEHRLMKELQEHWGEVLFIDGNHENFDRLKKFPIVQKYGAPVRQIAPKVFWLQRGEVYNIDDKTFFVMGGGDSIDKNRRTEGISWWSDEQPSYAELEHGMDSLDSVDWKVDYVLTHTCPLSSKIELGQKMNLVMSSDHLENYLENVQKQLKYKKWYFGHFHIDAELCNNMTSLYHVLVEVGEGVKSDDDDFISGMYSPMQTIAYAELPTTKEEVKNNMLAHYLGIKVIDLEFHQTKILDDDFNPRYKNGNWDDERNNEN